MPESKRNIGDMIKLGARRIVGKGGQHQHGPTPTHRITIIHIITPHIHEYLNLHGAIQAGRDRPTPHHQSVVAKIWS